ncbi:MAG TPA: DUF1801 domain-containing protein [Chitinophagaceae bacterium]|nr:DUF1801 domain-containing protein [Chitinophagaceae bacterium]
MKATSNTKFKTVDEYLSAVPANTKSILKKLRKTIKQAAPQAEELISYNMPAFKLNGMLVYYAAYKDHIGFYPTPSGIEAFKKELSDYEGAKGSVKFPIARPFPFDLISKIVKFRVGENLGKAGSKKK